MRSMAKILKQWMTFSLIILGVVHGQEFLNGSITYVSKDNAYMDLGKSDGLQAGDTIMVNRSGVKLGIALISQISGSSSALKAYQPDEIAWIIGDVVQVDIPSKTEERQPLAEKELTPASLIIAKKVFLDSSAYQARSRSGRTLSSERFLPSFSGYVSTRLDDRGGDPNSERRTSASIFGQFKILDLGIRNFDASMSLRSNQSSTDTNSSIQFYSLMFTYKQTDSPLTYLFGRLYHPQFSMLGTVDGLGATWKTKRRTIAILGGQEAEILQIANRPQRVKYGLLDEEHFERGNLQVGSISERENGELARSYLILGSTYRINKGLRLRAHSELDLDVMDQSQSQSFLSLTRFHTSMNWRPWRSLITSLRYSYRENIIDLLDTTATEFDQTARHAFNSNLSWMFNSGVTVAGQASFRTDGSGKDIQTYGLSFRQRSFSHYDFNLSTGSMLMLSYLSEGGRVYASLGKELNTWLDMDLYDEVFLYRILGDTDFRVRHYPEISLAAKVPGLNRLRLRIRFEQEDGETLHRVSLSASRQF